MSDDPQAHQVHGDRGALTAECRWLLQPAHERGQGAPAFCPPPAAQPGVEGKDLRPHISLCMHVWTCNMAAMERRHAGGTRAPVSGSRAWTAGTLLPKIPYPTPCDTCNGAVWVASTCVGSGGLSRLRQCCASADACWDWRGGGVNWGSKRLPGGARQLAAVRTAGRKLG